MAGPRDPYEIGRSLGIKDDILETWVQKFQPKVSAPASALPPIARPIELPAELTPRVDPMLPRNPAEADALARVAPGAAVGQPRPRQMQRFERGADDAPMVGGVSTRQAAKPGNDNDAWRAAGEFMDRLGRVDPDQVLPKYQQLRAALDEARDPETGDVRDGEKLAQLRAQLTKSPALVSSALDGDLADTSETRPNAGNGGRLQMVSPGGRTAHSWQVQEGLNLPGTIAAYGIADKSAREAAAAGRDAGVAEAERELAFLTRHEQLLEQRALEQRWKAEDRARRMQAEADKLAELTDAVREDKIDAGKFFTGNGTAGGFAASIAYVLGAIGGAMTGSGNPVSEIIRQEIQTQKDNAALRRQALGDQKGLLGELARTFEDERIAEHAAWLAYGEKAKVTMARIAGESKDDWVRARYQAALAGIDAELAPHVQALEAAVQDKVVRQDVNAPPTYAGGAAADLKPKEEEAAKGLSDALVKSGIPGARQDLNRLLSVIPKEGAIPGVGGVHGITSTLGGRAERADDAIYNFVGSTQGQEIRQAAAVLFNRQLKDESGAAVSDQELARQKAAFYGARDAGSARRALKAYGNRLNELEATVRSGANPKINEVQRARAASERTRLDKESGFSGPKAGRD